MALYAASFSADQTKLTVAAAVPSRVISVVRVCFAAYQGGWLRLYSDPNGTDEQVIVPDLYVAASATLDLRLGRRYAVSTAVGKALGLTTQIASPPDLHSILIWYELAG